LGAPPLGKSGIGMGHSATAKRVTRGGSTTTKPPISRALTCDGFEGERTRPPLICGALDLMVGGMDEAAEG